VTSPASGGPGAPILPDYAPVPRASLGPALNDQGYHVGPVEPNLYLVTDGDYHSAFLTTRDGIVLFGAPPSIGHNLQRAVNDIAATEGVGNTLTHLVYTHHHSDHAGASSPFGSNVVRIGHEETRRPLLRDNDPAKPAPEETFADDRTLEIGGERSQLARHGANHSPDNIYIHFPDHDTLMLVDIVIPGWAPCYGINLAEDVPGSMNAPATALSDPWQHLITGHLGRLGTRDDVTLHPAVHRRHRSRGARGTWRGQPHPVLPAVRGKHLGRGQGLPGCGGRSCRRARHQEVHRPTRGRGCVHCPHRLFDPGVDPPGPRLSHGCPPLNPRLRPT
jgi:glyoxylase-like metal-dependent hydrolase (beta-lactamase superfamily II)